MFRSFVLTIESFDSIDSLLHFNLKLDRLFSSYEMIVVCKNEQRFRHQLDTTQIDNFTNTKFIFVGGRETSRAAELWGGVDAAIGDRVTVIYEVPDTLESLREKIVDGESKNAIFFFPEVPEKTSMLNKVLVSVFRLLYKKNKSILASTQPSVVDLDRSFVNFLQRSSRPEISLRNSNLFSGFDTFDTRIQISKFTYKRNISDSLSRASEILFNKSTAPLRAISGLALIGAALNLMYSLYVVLVSLTEPVTRGWTSMSLQLSGMFLLISLVLAAICEFLIFSQRSLAQESPYFVQKISTSPVKGTLSELNIATE